MKLRNKISRLTALLILFLATLTVFASPDHSAAEAAEVGQKRAYYDICQSIPHFEDCFAMQGMAVLEDYIYTVKKNAADTKATIFRTNRFHGETVQMTFQGARSVDYLGHANDMCAGRVGANSYLFVTTMKKSVEALACFKISGTELIFLGVYNVYTAGGSNLTVSGLDVYEVKGNSVTLLLAQGELVFMGTVDVTAPAGNIYCPLGFQVDKTHMLQVAREACGIPELELTVQGSGFFNNTYYMPLTLHHNNATQIKADNHGDSTSVIVAFPNISEAISVVDRSVKASLSDTIYIPDAGEMFFEVESVDFADGILYFSSNRVRIDHSLTTVSLVLDPDVDMGIFTRRASFRQDGIYMLSGANATDYFLYDPGADDKHLEAGKYPADIHTYFGLESNEEGFYYIRSMLTKEYLTVNADCTVTKSAKKENDPSQLFCLTQVNWPNDSGHVAIISLLNYQYLNNEAGTTRSITTTSGKTYRLKKVQDTAALESSLFDFDLYTACYPKETAGMTEAQAKAHFNSTGKEKGYVASLFFDADYYLAHNPDVAAQESYGSPQGAYTHFVEYGFWEGRQGSLYYSINEYLHSGNDRLKTVDYPDKLFYIRHFRQYGANESLTREDRYGSDEFAVKEIVAEFGLTPASGYDFLVDYISRNVRLSQVKTQEDLEVLLFDWQYYIAKNPGLTESAVASFSGSTYAEKLHTHWIQYGIKEGRIASPYFDAAYYRKSCTDAGTNNAEAYQHFLTIGFWAHRAGSAYYDGTAYLYGRNPGDSVLCPHKATVTATKASTCTERGSETTSCCDCMKIISCSDLPLKAHTEAIDKAVAATCTTAGKTEGSHCSVCNTVLVAQTAVPATGHSYTSKVTTAATCTKAGVKTYTCSKCAHSYTEAIPATGHTPVTDKAVAATCTTAGKTEGSHCSVCNAVIKAQTTVPATGHSYTSKVTTAATCAKAGVKTFTCSKCNHSYTEAIAATGHTPVTDKAVAATCTTAGKTEGSHCSVCNAVIKAQTTVPATGHSYSSKVTTAATCTKEGVKTFTCSKCNHSYTEAIAAIGHTPVTDKAVAATCTTAGKTEGSHCSVCNAVIKAQTTVPATGHSYTSKVTTAATCTTAGVKTFTCSKCSHSYTEAIAATGHTVVIDKAVAATCTTAGKTEGSHCSVCNAVIKAQTAIPATGHSYTSKVTTAATCTKAGVKTFTCSKCNHSYTEAIAATGHTPVIDKAVAATCTTAGKTEGSHCSVCNAVIKAQTTIPATGHSYTSKVTTAATCTKAGVKTFTCSKCNHSYTEAIAATGHTPVTDKAVAATCTTAGKTEGSHCSVCNAVIKAQTTVPATGHSYTSKVTTAATCTKEGVKTYTCSKCSHSYTEAIAATGHTPVTDKAVAATCTTAGKTEGSHCSVCNAVIKAQETVPALGHENKYTDNGDGTHTGTCARCKDVFTEGHKFEGKTCFCGAKVLTLDESIKIYHTLDLASDISITFAVPQTALASYDSYYLEVVLPEYEGNVLTGTSTVQIQPVVNGNYYYFTLTGITAVRMGDLVDATLHMTRGTAQYVSVVDTYSVATYAYSMLSSTTDAKMLTLCADLLRYGAEAQRFKGYRTNALVDANMTKKQMTYLSNTENLTFTATDSYLGDLASPVLSWVGKTLDLGSKVGMKFVFNAKNYGGDIANLTMKVSYKGSNGETKTVTLTNAEVYNAKNGYYSFTFYGLLASELRTVVDVAVFDGETQLTQTLRYSAESYASKNTTGALGNLCKALFAYSDSAKAYFTK